MKWENLTSLEFDEAIEKSGGLCLLPIGCLEKHGNHISVGCDALIANRIANMAAELEYAVVFPNAFWLGDMFCTHALTPAETSQKCKRGNIALSPALLLNAMTEICNEIHRNGFRKILILNAHGGNVPFLNFFIRAQGYAKRDYATMWAWVNRPSDESKVVYEQVTARPEDFPPLTQEELATLKQFAETGYGGGHGDFQEVALTMGQTPDYVRPELFQSLSGSSTHLTDHYKEMGITVPEAWSANYPNDFHGFYPLGCTENIGKVHLQLCAEYLAGIIKMLKEDEFCVKLAQKAE